VGLVIFDDVVTIFGDANSDPVIIAGDKLNSFDTCLNAGNEAFKVLLSKSLGETCDNILSKFSKLNPNGKTALGPALLAALGLASQGNAGSRVIICTDGLANVGLGDLERNYAEAKEFYEKLGTLAKEKGTSISVITIKGEGCNIEILGKISDMTNGSVTRVDVNEMEKQFANIMKEEVIATGVELNILLHKGLKFRKEDEKNLSYNGTKCFKNIGNVTTNTQTTCEYDVKSQAELLESKMTLEGLTSIPLQAQIVYRDLQGNKYIRVITRTQNISHNKEEVEKHANISVLATHAVQQNAKLALDGKSKEAEAKAQEWEAYMVDKIGSKQDKDSKRQIEKFQEQNQQLVLAIQSQDDFEKDNKGKNEEEKDEISAKMYNLKQINTDMFD